MDTIQIKDKQFTVSIKEQDIQKEVIRVANEINRDLAGKSALPQCVEQLVHLYRRLAEAYHDSVRNFICEVGILSGGDFHRSN